MKLSVIIPTYNEEAYIADAIHSVSFADEIIIIDSYSTDQTVEIAEKMNCKILFNKFENYSKQKNLAIPHAQGEWILFLDADERISIALRNEIISAIENPGENRAYKLQFPHFFINRFLYRKADKVTRLVYNKDILFTGDVHEKLNIPDGTTKILSQPVLHYTYKGIYHYLSKKESYSWFQAGEMLKRNKKTNYFHLVFKPFYRFFHIYFIKRGFLDGIPGLAGATFDAYGVFARYAKLILLQKNLK